LEKASYKSARAAPSLERLNVHRTVEEEICFKCGRDDCGLGSCVNFKGMSMKKAGYSYHKKINHWKNDSEKGRYKSALSSESREKRCLKCGRVDCELKNCADFRKSSLRDKFALLRRKGVCYCCLERGHRWNDCPQKRRCNMNQCKHFHHRALHKFETREETTVQDLKLTSMQNETNNESLTRMKKENQNLKEQLERALSELNDMKKKLKN
jgi:hypothetical protein